MCVCPIFTARQHDGMRCGLSEAVHPFISQSIIGLS